MQMKIFFFAYVLEHQGFTMRPFATEEQRDEELHSFLTELWTEAKADDEGFDIDEPTLKDAKTIPINVFDDVRGDDGDRLYVDWTMMEVPDPVKEGADIPPREPEPPRYQRTFRDFDYDYIALMEADLAGWRDESWHNDAMPKAVAASDDRFMLWFDYADPEKSELADGRRAGENRRFALTCDWPDEGSNIEPGTVLFATDSWEEMRSFINDGPFEFWIAQNPKQLPIL